MLHEQQVSVPSITLPVLAAWSSAGAAPGMMVMLVNVAVMPQPQTLSQGKAESHPIAVCSR